MREVQIDRDQLEAVYQECQYARRGYRVAVYYDLDDGTIWAKLIEDNHRTVYRGHVIRAADVAQPISRERLEAVIREAVTAETEARETLAADGIFV